MDFNETTDHGSKARVRSQEPTGAHRVPCQCQGKFALVSSAIHQCHEQIVKAAKRGGNLLLRGPSGTGKTVCAHCYRHHHRDEFRRAPDRFQAVNCAAIPLNLLESELFGHVRGAFTGAVADRKGLIRSADRGIVFLDEIGELNPAAQAALLKVIEERKVRPVGSDREYDVDVVFIMASNLDFEKAIREQRFREDLYFRLAQVEVRIPALAERPEDVRGIIALMEGGPTLLSRLDDPAKDLLYRGGEGIRYPWRGNGREVKKFVENMADHIARGGPITFAQCREVLMPVEVSSPSGVGSPRAPMSIPIDWNMIFDKASTRALLSVGNSVNEFADWSKAILVGKQLVKRMGITSLSQMPGPDDIRKDPIRAEHLLPLTGELKVAGWTTVADHYDGFLALLAGTPHPHRGA